MLLELFVKALKRLRAYHQAASAMQVTIRYRKKRGVNGAYLPMVTPERSVERSSSMLSEGIWVRKSRKHLHANDDHTWLRVLRPILDAMPDLSPTAEPCYVGIMFSELLAVQDMNLSLFEDYGDAGSYRKWLEHFHNARTGEDA